MYTSLNMPYNCKYRIDELEPNPRQPADCVVLPNALATFYGLNGSIKIREIN